MDASSQESVNCTKCGKVDHFPVGYLTEQAKREYKCRVCRQVVAEVAVEEANIGDRQLLTEG